MPEPIEAPIEVKLDAPKVMPKKPSFGTKPSFGIKKPTFGLGAKKSSFAAVSTVPDPIPVRPPSVRKSISEEIDIDENIPTIESQVEEPLKKPFVNA